MLFDARLKFWLIAVFLLFYVIAVLVLSTTSLQGLKRNSFVENAPTLSKQTLVNKPSAARGGHEYGLGGIIRPLMKRMKVQWCSKLKYVKLTEENQYKKPVALVSFPGSGNTWLRYLLQQATGYFTGSVYKDYGLLKNGFSAESVVNNSVIVVKTHEWGTNTRNMFSKAILLIRRPGPAIQAEFNRQSGGHIGFASADRYSRSGGKNWQQFVSDKIKGWQQLNLDWLYNFTGPTHVILYENLVNQTTSILETVIKFLGLPIDPQQFQCALERQEGIYRRRKHVLNFDPFTQHMKKKLSEVESLILKAIEKVGLNTNKR